MKEWILSIVGTIALGVLVDILLPEGKIAKYVKGAFSLLVVLVISSIVPIIAGMNIQFDVDSSDVFAVERSDTLHSQILFEDKIQAELKKHGCECNVQVEWENTLATSVMVYVSSSNIDGAKIVQIVADCLSINKNAIKVLYLN